MRQEDLAVCVGCSLSMIRKIEYDERRPSEQIALRLADCLNLSTNDRNMLMKVARGEHAVTRLGWLLDVPRMEMKQTGTQVRTLPTQMTRFVGRSSELQAIINRLVRPECRLLTLIGPGGIGKTRLAIQAAQNISGFADGVYFIPLAPLLTAEYLALTIAETLDLTVMGAGDPQIQLINHLAEKELLLILDDFDHLLDGAGLAARLLECAPRVKILVTSRERLNLQGEWLFPVEGLNLPDRREIADPQNVDALQFFFETAHHIKPGFSLEENWHDAVRICSIVEGSPLGIELAVAQLHILSCREIADRLATNLDLLSSPLLDIPEQHRSMRGVMDHSWDLLSAKEQYVLARLSVFRSGFTLEAVEQIAGGSFSVVSSLIEKSLVYVHSAGRYSLHTLLRQYAGEKLAGDPSQVSDTEQKHSQYFTDFLHHRELALSNAGQIAAREEIDVELQNIHAAWQRALAYHLVADIEKASNSLMIYYHTRGRDHEGFMAFAAASKALEGFETAETADRRALAQILSHHSMFELMTRSYSPQTRAMCEKSLATAHAIGWREEEAFATCLLGLCSGSFVEAEQFFKKSLSLLETLPDASYGWVRGSALSGLGMLAIARGDEDRAAVYFRELLSTAESTGDFWFRCVAHYYLEKVALLSGRYQDAQAHSTDTLAIASENNFQTYIVLSLIDMARLACWKQGDYLRAKTMLSESLARQNEMGFVWMMPITSALLGNACCGSGDYEEAQTHFHDALLKATAVGYETLVAEILSGYGILLARTGEKERALDILVSVTNLPAREDAGTRAEEHSLALQQMHIGVEDRMARAHLEDSRAALRGEMEAEYGPEKVKSALEDRHARSLDEIATSLLAQVLQP